MTEAGRSPGRAKPPPVELRKIAEQEVSAAEGQGPLAGGLPRPPRPAAPAATLAPAATAAPPAGVALDMAVTGPGGAVLAGACPDVSCGGGIFDSMVVPGEPVTVSAQVFYDGAPGAAGPVQVAFQQFCANADSDFETTATTTVTGAPLTTVNAPGSRYRRASMSRLPAATERPPMTEDSIISY